MIKRNKPHKRISCFVFAFLFIIFPFPGNGGIIFSDLDLSSDNKLLFRAGTGGSQNALFLTRLSGALPGYGHALQQLTAFPEKMDLLEKGRVLQIRNSFGALRMPVSGGLPMPVPGLPSFAGGNVTASGRSEEMASSADGRWLLYLDPVSPAFANLIMLDVYSGEKTKIAGRLDRPEKSFPASWSPDSRFFVYERAGKLYYYMAGSSLMPGDEKARLIGDGSVNSISWSRLGDFYYLRNSTLLRVRGSELFTRTLYADFLEIGTVAGRIPFEFDPYFDSFWIAPDARSLLVSKGRRSLFYYPLGEGENTGGTVLPYLALPRSCAGINVLWSPAGAVTILVSIPKHSGTTVNAWRLNNAGSGAAVFETLPPPAARTKKGSFPSGSLSPDGSLALFWGTGGILLYDYINWKLLDVLGAVPGTTCLWAGDDEFFTGDEQKIERVRLTPMTEASRISRREMICLSGVHQFAFEENTFRILAKNGDAWFVTDGRSPWTLINNPRLKTASQVSGQYRVYLERQGAGYFANLPMIRNTASVGTFSLFPPVARSGDLPPARYREAALCFDLYDDDHGLPEILDALNRYDIKATFFLNGEFIRRYPAAVADIAAAGHECASMFFALIDLSDARYRTDSDFISRGLARNEDEFYAVTGKELALLWHPPWYMNSQDIAAAAARAGYAGAGRDIDPLDWVSREDEKRLGLPQHSPSEMIDGIMKELKPGSVIPVRLGLLPGGRNDYLFNRINVLLDALIRDGYALTTVSAIIERK